MADFKGEDAIYVIVTEKRIFEPIIRPHPFTKNGEKGCGLTFALKIEKTLETLRVSRVWSC